MMITCQKEERSKKIDLMKAINKIKEIILSTTSNGGIDEENIELGKVLSSYIYDCIRTAKSNRIP